MEGKSDSERHLKVDRAVAPVDRHSRRSSNLEVILSTITPCLSKKCIAISPTEAPLTTTLAPLDTIS